MFLIVLNAFSVYSISTSDRRRYKTLIQSTNVDLRSFETEFSIAVCRPTGNNWQSKTLFLAICDTGSSIVQSVFDCRLSGMLKKAHFMVTEIVWSFLHKSLATIS